ncbi:MAG: DEAD/DEAH box helicase, partial [Gemmataceae bacterium]
MSALSITLDRLPGVTPNRRALLAKLNLSTVGDLLRHFPRGYEDLSEVRAIADLQPDRPQMVQGEVIEMETREISGGRFVLSVVLTDDGRNILEGVWFNQGFMARRFRYGQRLSFAGKPKWFRDRWQISNPKVQGIDGEDPVSPGIVPIYPLTEDLRPDVLRQLIGKALDLHGSAWPERLPPNLREKHGWPDVLDALRQMHFPSSLQAARQARLRFIYEELLILQLALALRRRELRDRQKAPILENSPRIDERIRALFPFSLTPDQDEAIAEITRDLASPRPMQRLLQADVGAGKTAVAVYAMLVAVACKHQAVLMAPTEVLARQHALTLEGYLANSRVRRLLLTGGMPARQRREALDALKSGKIDLVVGTQALVQ